MGAREPQLNQIVYRYRYCCLFFWLNSNFSVFFSDGNESALGYLKSVMQYDLSTLHSLMTGQSAHSSFLVSNVSYFFLICYFWWGGIFLICSRLNRCFGKALWTISLRCRLHRSIRLANWVRPMHRHCFHRLRFWTSFVWPSYLWYMKRRMFTLFLVF